MSQSLKIGKKKKKNLPLPPDHPLFCSAGLGLLPPTQSAASPECPVPSAPPLHLSGLAHSLARLGLLPPTSVLHDPGRELHIPQVSVRVLCGPGFLTSGSSEPLPGSRGQRAWRDPPEPPKSKGRRPAGSPGGGGGMGTLHFQWLCQSASKGSNTKTSEMRKVKER